MDTKIANEDFNLLLDEETTEKFAQFLNDEYLMQAGHTAELFTSLMHAGHSALFAGSTHTALICVSK